MSTLTRSVVCRCAWMAAIASSWWVLGVGVTGRS
jgi:hypothetical protein